MPKVMKEKCFILFFAVFIVIVKVEGGLDYYDCGSTMDIKTVYVSNCDQLPCIVSPGDHLSVEITLSEVNNLNRTELVTEAFIQMFGLKWNLNVTPVNPCSQWHCPVYAVNNLTYTADVEILENLIKRPGHVQLDITYDANNGLSVHAICIQFEVNLQ